MPNEITSAVIGGIFALLAAILNQLINHLFLQRQKNSREHIDTKLDVSQEKKPINRLLKFFNKPLIYGLVTIYVKVIPFVFLMWAFYVPPGTTRTISLIASSFMLGMLAQSSIENFINRRLLNHNHLDAIGDEWAHETREELNKLTRMETGINEKLDKAIIATKLAEEMVAKAQTIAADVDAALAKVTEMQEQTEKGLQEFETLSKECDTLSQKSTALQIEIAHQTLIRVAHLAGQIENQLRSKPTKD